MFTGKAELASGDAGISRPAFQFQLDVGQKRYLNIVRQATSLHPDNDRFPGSNSQVLSRINGASQHDVNDAQTCYSPHSPLSSQFSMIPALSRAQAENLGVEFHFKTDDNIFS